MSGQSERGRSEPSWLPSVLGGLLAVFTVFILWTALYPAPHNGGDNAGYLTLAHSLVTDGAYVDRWDPAAPAHTKYPPLYPLVLAGAMLLGAKSWTAFKALSVLFVLGSVLITYAWAARRAGMWVGAAIGVLVAVSPAFLWASSWILSDPLFVLLTLTALYAFDRGAETTASAAAGDAAADAPPDAARPGGLGAVRGAAWLWVGAAAAVLATFTRTAGLPLVLAVMALFGLRRRWKQLGIFAAGFGLPSLAWWLRSRSSGDAQYISEFWMVDPYQPELGGAGLVDLLARVVENLSGYAFEHIPGGLTVYGSGVLSLIGIVLLSLAIGGWIWSIRHRVGLAELFMPLYLGLILLWPAVWSGDRFALPLYPLLLFFAWRGIAQVSGRLHRLAPVALGLAAAAVLVIPSVRAWVDATKQAAECAPAVRAGGPFACYHPGFQEFVAASRWLGEHAPEDAVILSRKPRIFYTLSGLPSRTYPFTTDPDVFLAEARRIGARYVILDRVDRLGYAYVGSVVTARPGAFCGMASIGGDAAGATQIIGIRAQEQPANTEGQIRLEFCAPEMVLSTPTVLPDYSTSILPLLALATP